MIALAVVVGLVAWMVTRDGNGDDEAAPPAATDARLIEPAELGNVAATAGHPVYWAGEVEGRQLELTESPEGGVQVRYLEEGTEAGEGPVEALTVGSYPLPDPEQALDAFAELPGAIVRRGEDGRKVVSNNQRRSSVYFVDPDNSVQVEVYDPSPQRAMSLARSGQARPAD